MNTLANHQARIAIATDAAALPFPPTSVAVVPEWWGDDDSAGRGVIPQVDVEVWSSGALSFTASEILSGSLHALTIADDVFTATHGTDTLNAAVHGLLTGDGPIQLTTDDTLPAGLELATDYWVIKTGAGTLKVAASLADALNGVAVAITDDGTGTHTLVDVASTSRVHFHSHGALQTPIVLDGQRGFVARVNHRPGVVCYALVGTLSAGTASAAIIPVSELG